MANDDLGDRMKGYENVQRMYLAKRTPTIIRVDGKAFHTFTRGLKKPCDMVFLRAMWDTAKFMCENIMGCKVAYVQSDEITLLLTDYDNLNTEAWFNKNVVKMISVSASMATLAFNRSFRRNVENEASKNTIDVDKYIDRLLSKLDTAMFDSRVFNLSKEEVTNCFIWRQQDATRNAIQSAGHFYFSQKQLMNKNCSQIQEMLFQEKGINFNDYPAYQKRGVCVIKETDNRSRWIIDEDIPIFTQDRNYIEQLI